MEVCSAVPDMLKNVCVFSSLGASRGRADALREVRDYVLSYPRCGSHHNSFFLTSIELLLPFDCFFYGGVCTTVPL